MADTSLNAPGIRYPNDYTLINLTLFTSTINMDVRSILIELSYNEDVFNNTASGYLMVGDSQGFINSLMLNGNEFIRISFGKGDTTTNIIDKTFRVFNITRRIPQNDGNTETYSIYFCSEELILSEQYKISKSYKGSDITTNINDILNTYLKVPAKKISRIDKTYGVYDFIVPYLKPFDAINWLSSYARPGENDFGSWSMIGSDMVFYENKFGYNFRSLQSLYSQSPLRQYFYNPKNLKVTDMAYNLSNALSYEIMDSFDTLGAINQGVFSNRLLSLDVLLRRYKKTDFNYNEYTQKASHLNYYPIINNYENRFGDKLFETPEAAFKLVFTNSNQNDSPLVASLPGSVAHDVFSETYIPNRTAQIPLANYTRVKISVPGDPALTAGIVINFNLTSKNPNPMFKDSDKFYSGNYLVTAVRHLLTPFQYRTVLELCKESTLQPYASVNNNSTGWTNAVKGNM
jgi:hypothetical protein